MQRIKLNVADLTEGMYVAQLDRPWLETPFLFQGFEVSEHSEIDLLRQFCRDVYIDISRGSIPAHEMERIVTRRKGSPADDFKPRPGVSAAKPSLRFRLLATLARFDPTGRLEQRIDRGRDYPIRRTLKQEVPHAAEAYEEALGAVNDVFARVQNGQELDLAAVKQSVDPMIESVLRNPGAMTWFALLRKRDSYTYNHSIATAVWGAVLGRHLGFDREGIEILVTGGLLLDVGKARLPEALLRKEGDLSSYERMQFERHVELGLELVKKTPGVRSEVLDMISSHHERHDGSGYPAGLQGADIPVYGRIAGLIDCYDAMTSQRSYASAMSSYEAIRELNGMAGAQFQKELVEQFVQALGMFPAGSLVELKTGEVGIVVEQNRVRRLRPKVMVVLDANHRPVMDYTVIDLNKVSGDSREESSNWIVTGHEPGAFGIDPARFLLA